MGTWTPLSKHSNKPTHRHIIHNMPKQYLQGWIEFYRLRFKVDGRVLIPRPETELLVDEIINYCKLSPVTYPLILDIGTGSGNIAISLAKNLPKAKIFATDISEEALELAKENARLNKIQNRIFFIKSDLLEFSGPKAKIDIIATNLPYIPRGRIPYLDPSVKDFEPWIALDGGSDGFDLYRKLFQQIKEKGWKPKFIVCEIDYTHGELAQTEAKKYFPNAQVEVKTDLAQNIRILIIH